MNERYEDPRAGIILGSVLYMITLALFGTLQPIPIAIGFIIPVVAWVFVT